MAFLLLRSIEMFGNYIVRAEFANNLQLLKVVHVLFPIQFNIMNLWSNTNLGLPLIFWSGFSRLASLEYLPPMSIQ
jgi:hypothetical protein